jgi:LuxR family maltose regulon positive regulatory protein
LDVQPLGTSPPGRLRNGIVKRPRLDHELDRGWDASLTLVVAPAGYGKTVAVQTWLAGRAHAAAWVPVDVGDNDPVRLWSSIATAVEREREGLGRSALERLRSPAGVVRPAIDALAAALAGDGRPLVVVLDDLQVIDEADCLRSLDYAVAALPGNVHLVVMSRAVPRLRLARLRGQGQLVELCLPALAFTPPEAKLLFDAVDGVSLDDDGVAAITAQTEGWGAALYLAALWLRERRDDGDPLPPFGGSHRHVSEYLTGEVLNGLEPDTRRFLLETSILTRLSGPLCDALLGETGSRGRLRALERSNLLVIPLGERPGWYRYHTLLREHLVAGLELDAAAALRRRALTWSLERGLVEDAAEYAQAAGEWDALAGLIEANQYELLRTGRGATLARWTASLPRAALLEHPGALVAAVIAAHVAGRTPTEIRRLIALARAVGIADAEAGLQLAIASYNDDHVGETLAAAESAVELASEQVELQVTALAILAVARLLAGDDAHAAEPAKAALLLPDAAELPYGYIAATAALAILDARAGRPISARANADRALAMTRAAELTIPSSGSRAQLADALVSMLEGRHAHAQRAAEHAVRTTIDGGLWQAWALLELTDIQLRRGHLVAASRSLSHAGELLAAARDAGGLPARAGKLRSELEAARAGASGPLAERPSAAELAVLRLLPGHTVREMAETLYLSTNTIKSHLRAIYRKLGVNARDDAVARAVALGLLDEPDP